MAALDPEQGLPSHLWSLRHPLAALPTPSFHRTTQAHQSFHRKADAWPA